MLSLREWAPLSDLFNTLPTKAQSGLFTQDIKLTSVDVLPEFIALGTNFGLVYWYDRKKKDIQKLRCESSNGPITVVKIISTVDYMVACGNSEGNISIFQVPKSHHESLPENLRPKDKQVERYTVSELHNASISALEWSKNGMRLFSGDKNGHVVLTEIDFYMHICKSVEILNESYEVVQLSYFHQLLLISTTYRSIICKKEDKWKISQVGKKDRKVLGNFGGTFYQNSLKPKEAILYCTRPGLRLWVSDVEGSVQQTLLYKDILNKRSPEVALINPVSKALKNLMPQKEASFGILLPFKENLLVTYNNDVLYILNPKEFVVTTIVNHLRGILAVSVHKDEIFILEGERSLIRLSDHPEPLHESTSIAGVGNFTPISTLFKGLSNKLQASSVLSTIQTSSANDVNIHTDPPLISNAEEAKESPVNTPIKANQKQNMYDEIGNQEYDDNILFRQKRHKKFDPINASSCSSVSSDECEGSISKGTLMTLSTVGILPDLRSTESIKQDIEAKEKMLADLLHLDQVKISCDIAQLENVDNTDCTLSIKWEIPQDTSDSIQAPTKDTDKRKITFLDSKKAPMPVCVDIPTDWQLQNLQVPIKDGPSNLNSTINDWKLERARFKSSERRLTESSISDISGEWEII